MGDLAGTISLLAGGGITLLYPGWLLRTELKLHSLEKTFQNKFVLLSLSMGIFSSLSCFLDIIYLDNIGAGYPLSGRFWFIGFLVVSVELHIYLLYLRTSVLLQLYPKRQAFLQGYVVFVQFTGLFNAITSGLIDFTSSPIVAGMFSGSTFLFAFCTALMDLSTATIFALHIREQRKMLKLNSFAKSSAQQPTEIISSYGVCIALVSLSTSLVPIIYLKSPALTLLTCVGAILWIRMKLRLEQISEEAKNEPTKPVTNPKQVKLEKEVSPA
jgi:hypothetical protein